MKSNPFLPVRRSTGAWIEIRARESLAGPSRALRWTHDVVLEEDPRDFAVYGREWRAPDLWPGFRGLQTIAERDMAGADPEPNMERRSLKAPLPSDMKSISFTQPVTCTPAGAKGSGGA